jgi:hypothetical protein
LSKLNPFSWFGGKPEEAAQSGNAKASQIFNKPGAATGGTAIVGENGPERLTVTPMGKATKPKKKTKYEEFMEENAPRIAQLKAAGRTKGTFKMGVLQPAIDKTMQQREKAPPPKAPGTLDLIGNTLSQMGGVFGKAGTNIGGQIAGKVFGKTETASSPMAPPPITRKQMLRQQTMERAKANLNYNAKIRSKTPEQLASAGFSKGAIDKTMQQRATSTTKTQVGGVDQTYDRMRQEQIETKAGTGQSADMSKLETVNQEQADLLDAIKQGISTLVNYMRPSETVGQSSQQIGSTATINTPTRSTDYATWQFGKYSGNASKQVVNNGT